MGAWDVGELGCWPKEQCIKLNRNGFRSAHMARSPTRRRRRPACVDLMPMVSASGITEQLPREMEGNGTEEGPCGGDKFRFGFQSTAEGANLIEFLLTNSSQAALFILDWRVCVYIRRDTPPPTPPLQADRRATEHPRWAQV